MLSFYFSSKAILSYMLLELLQRDLGYPEKMNFGAEELVPVQSVMELHLSLRVKFSLLLVEEILLQRKQYT